MPSPFEICLHRAGFLGLTRFKSVGLHTSMPGIALMQKGADMGIGAVPQAFLRHCRRINMGKALAEEKLRKES